MSPVSVVGAHDAWRPAARTAVPEPVSFASVPILIAVSIMLISLMGLAAHSTVVANRYNAIMFTSPLLAAATIGVALWTNPTTDRLVYARQLTLMHSVSAPWNSDLFDRDPMFSVYLWTVGRLMGLSAALLFALTAVVLLCAYITAGRLLKMQSWAIAGALVSLIASGYFSAYTGVAIRQGMAMAALLVAMGIVISKRRLTWTAAPFLASAALLHWSAALFAAALATVAVARPSRRVLLGVWASCLALTLTGVAQTRLSAFDVSMLDVYSSENAYASYGHIGLRLDFVILSALLTLIAFVVTQKWSTPQGDWLYANFVAFNAIYLLLGHVAFSDRLAAYSFILVPLAAWYALSVVASTREVPRLSIAAIMIAATTLGTLNGQWEIVSAWW